MKHALTFVGIMLLMPLALFPAEATTSGRNHRATVFSLFEAVSENGGTVTIPPGNYYLDGTDPVPLSSRVTVSAFGARFHVPKTLRDKARTVLFAGENVSDFRWFGGHFQGYVFDPAKTDNTWEPNANTRAILDFDARM